MIDSEEERDLDVAGPVPMSCPRRELDAIGPVDELAMRASTNSRIQVDR